MKSKGFTLIELMIVPSDETIEFTQSAAKHRFITPSKDMDSVIEESIMLCEGAYC